MKFNPPSTLQFLNISFGPANFLLLKTKCVKGRAINRHSNMQRMLEV